jgi:hypothetical protein
VNGVGRSPVFRTFSCQMPGVRLEGRGALLLPTGPSIAVRLGSEHCLDRRIWHANDYLHSVSGEMQT